MPAAATADDLAVRFAEAFENTTDPTLKRLLGEVIEKVKGLAAGPLKKFLQRLWQKLKHLGHAVVGFFVALCRSVASATKEFFGAVWDAIKSFWGWVVDHFKTLWNAFVNWFKSL